MKPAILIIDDEAKLRMLLSRLFKMEGYRVFEAGTGEEGLSIAAAEPIQVIITDVRLPDASGIDLVSRLKTIRPQSEIIVLTAFGHIPDTVTAIKAGAFDYLTKGDEEDLILPCVERALEKISRAETGAPSATLPGFKEIQGNSPVLQEVLALASRVAPTDTPVLLLGETGTGKELFAHALHAGSRRNKGPFIPLNCSAIPKDLLESELFGYKAGAFTGASRDKKGLIGAAAGGTLFLDEIGDLNPDLQAKLLRVLESGRFILPGDIRETRADVRFIAATNKNLEQDVRQGIFRADLYYRLSVFTIHLPPLRDRRDDIPVLAETLLEQISGKLGSVYLQTKLTLEDLLSLKGVEWQGRIPAKIAFFSPEPVTNETGTIPLSLQTFITRYHVLPSSMALITVRISHKPVWEGKRTERFDLPEGLISLVIRYGYMEEINLGTILEDQGISGNILVGDHEIVSDGSSWFHDLKVRLFRNLLRQAFPTYRYFGLRGHTKIIREMMPVKITPTSAWLMNVE